MKKLSKELIISGVFALVMIILSIVLIRVGDFSNLYNNFHADSLSSVAAIGAAALAVAMFITVFCAAVPIIMVLVEFLFTLIARLFNIGEVKKWKKIVWNIFFITALVVHALLVILYIYIVIAIKTDIYLIPLFISLLVLILMIIIYAKKDEK